MKIKFTNKQNLSKKDSAFQRAYLLVNSNIWFTLFWLSLLGNVYLLTKGYIK